MSTKTTRKVLELLVRAGGTLGKDAQVALAEVEAIEKALCDLREVAFDGPSEMKGTRCAESVSGWRQRIDKETQWVKEIQE